MRYLFDLCPEMLMRREFYYMIESQQSHLVYYISEAIFAVIWPKIDKYLSAHRQEALWWARQSILAANVIVTDG